MAKKSEAFYERLRRLLEEAGLTDAEAAACSGLSVSQISRLKSGEATAMKMDSAIRLSDRLGISPHYLATGREKAPTATLHFDGRRLSFDLRFQGESPGVAAGSMAQHAVLDALRRAGIEVLWERPFTEATRPAVSADEMVGPLPEELGRLIQAVRDEAKAAFELAQKAQATADEAKSLSQRRGRRSA